MKDKLNLWDIRDIGGTKPIPILSLAYSWSTFCSLSLGYPWPLILCPHSLCGYCQNSFTTLTNKRKETL